MNDCYEILHSSDKRHLNTVELAFPSAKQCISCRMSMCMQCGCCEKLHLSAQKWYPAAVTSSAQYETSAGSNR